MLGPRGPLAVETLVNLRIADVENNQFVRLSLAVWFVMLRVHPGSFLLVAMIACGSGPR